MSKRFTIALDAMGGDHAPVAEVCGAHAAVQAHSNIDVILVGQASLLKAELGRLGPTKQISIVSAAEVVSMDDAPVAAYRQKRDSSLRVAFNLLAGGDAEALVSAGNSGAVLVHANMVLRKIPGVDRPCIVAVWPTPDHGSVVLCDVGANSSVSPRMLAQFGVLGACFDSVLSGRLRPQVAILSNGSEASKGTELTREASRLLEQASKHPDAEFEFIGYVEGDQVFEPPTVLLATSCSNWVRGSRRRCWQ